MKRDRSANRDYVDALRKQHETAMRMHEAATWTGTHTPMALPTSPAVQPAAAGAAPLELQPANNYDNNYDFNFLSTRISTILRSVPPHAPQC